MSKWKGRPSWFKVWRKNAGFFQALPDETAGRVLKALFEYMESGTPPESMDELTNMGFKAMRYLIDDAYKDYEVRAENGSKGGLTRAENARKGLDDAE